MSVLIKHGSLFIAVVVLTVVASIGMMLTASETYTSRAIIGFRPVADSKVPNQLISDISNQLIEKHNIRNKLQTHRTLPFVNNIIRVGNLIVVTALGKSSEGATRFLEQTVEEEVHNIREGTGDVISLTENHIEQQRKIIASLDLQRESFSSDPAKALSKDPALADLIYVERSRVLTATAEARKELMELEVTLAQLKAGLIEVIVEPTPLNDGNPTSPRLSNYLLLGGLLGIVLGFFAVVARSILTESR